MNYLILAATAAATQAADKEMNMWDMIIMGGWLMIPIFVLSIIAVYIMFERYFAIRNAAVTDKNFTEKILDYIRSGNKTAALMECNAVHTPLARMLEKGVKYSNLPSGELRTSMENSANGEVAELEKGLSTLATSAGLAPMIGFLGTVVGMVQAFYDMSLAGNNINITLLSRGIYTAMITTVAGLIVGIIAYWGYNALVSKLGRLTGNLEYACAEFIDSLHDLKK